MLRAEELLRTMTIDEKVMQLSAVYPMNLLGAEGPIRSQLDAHRVLRDTFALGLFDDPYGAESPGEIRALASEGVDLSRRLAAESVPQLKNEGGLRRGPRSARLQPPSSLRATPST